MKLKVNIALDQHLLVGFTKIKHFTGKMFFLDGNSSVDCPWFHRLTVKNGRLSAGTIKAGGADDTAKTPEWVGGTWGFPIGWGWVVGWLGELGVGVDLLFVGWSYHVWGGNDANLCSYLWSCSRVSPYDSALFGLVI